MTPCIPWPGRIDPGGYGTLGKKLAHRLMWERVHGEIPKHLTVDHRCRRRDCINPDHLRLATWEMQTENRKPRSDYRPVALRTHCKNGHRFDYENTYFRKDGSGRSCRRCVAENTRRYKARKRNEEEAP